MRLALQPGLNALLASSQQLVHAQGCVDVADCECLPCTYYPSDLFVRAPTMEVEISGVTSSGNCQDCGTINGVYHMPRGPEHLDIEDYCGPFRAWELQSWELPALACGGLGPHGWRIGGIAITEFGITAFHFGIVVSGITNQGFTDHLVYGFPDWDRYFPGGLPSEPPFNVVPTEEARLAIQQLCAGEWVELPFKANIASFYVSDSQGFCNYDNATVRVRINTEQHCVTPPPPPNCAQQAYVEITVSPGCTWDWSVVSGSGCDCNGTELVRTDNEVCVEIVCADGSRRTSCASVTCGPDEGTCASQVVITYSDDCAGQVPRRRRVSIPDACNCQVVLVPTIDPGSQFCFDITCDDGSAVQRCIENPCWYTDPEGSLCIQHHIEFRPGPELVPDWEHSCPCIGPFDEFFSRYVSEKYDVLFEYKFPLQYTCLFQRQRWEVDLTPLNDPFMLREKLFSGPCSLGRRIDFSGYRAEGRSCDGLPFVLETEVTTEFETDPITQEPVEYTRIRWYEYFVEAIEVHLPGGVFFTANKYRVGELLQQGAHGMPDFVQRGSCVLVGSADTRLFDNTTMDQNAIGNQLRTGPCLGNRYCETRALSDFEFFPDWILHCAAGLEEGEVRWCLSLACAA